MQYPPIKMLVFLMFFASVAAAANWTIVGDGVQWSNANAKISVAPHTSTDPITQVQYANFSWNGTPVTVNISFVFNQPITSGRVDLLQNVTRQVSVPTTGRVNYSILLPNVSSYVATNESCQIGDAQNTLRYIVNYSVNDTANSTVACFNSYTNISSNYTLNYQVNGTVYAYQNQTQPEWTDISSIFTEYAYGNYRVYTVNNVQFTNPTLYQTRLTYNIPIALKSGKFSIYIHTGSPDEVIAGTASVYLELDPGWSSYPWIYKRKVSLIAPSFMASNITNPPAYFVLDTATLISAGKMQSNCDDIRIVDHTETAQLNYSIETGTCNTSNTTIFTRLGAANTSTNFVFLYYGNPSANDASNANSVFEEFIGVWHGGDNSDSKGINNMSVSGTISNVANTTGCWLGKCWSFNTTTSYLQTSGNAVGFNNGATGLVISAVCWKPALNNETVAYGFSTTGVAGSDLRASCATNEIQYAATSGGSAALSGACKAATKLVIVSILNSSGITATNSTTKTATNSPSANMTTGQFMIGATPVAVPGNEWGKDGMAFCDEVRVANGTGKWSQPSWIAWEYGQTYSVNVELSLQIITVNISNSSSNIGTSIYANTPIFGLVNATNQNTNPINATWRFYLNSALYSNGSASNITDASLVNLGNVSNLSKGQNWTFEAIVTDANNSAGIAANSSTITIQSYNVSVGTPTFNVAIIAENATILVNSLMTSSHAGVGWQNANTTLTYSNGSQQTVVMSILTGNATNGTWQGSAITLNISGLVNATIAAYTNATPTDTYLSNQSTFRLDNTPPNATLSISNANFVAPLSVTFSAFVTDDNLTKNATLYIGGADWGQMLNVTATSVNATFNLTVQPNASGIFNAYAIVYDYVGHPYQTANVSFNVSNYTVTQNRSITSVNETLTFSLNKTFNISVAYKLIFAVQGNSTVNFTYSLLFPDSKVTAGRTTNASNWANITNGINITIPPSSATYSAGYIVENTSVSTDTGGTDTRYVNVTSPNINGTAQYYKIAFLMPSSFDPTTQHIRIRTYRLGSWATVGDGNLQQGENFASLQIYNFTTSNTSSYKDTVAVMLDLSNEHILEFSIQSGAEDVSSTPSGGDGGGGGGGYSTTTTTISNGKELPSVAAFEEISTRLDTFLKSKTVGISNAGISIVALLIFLSESSKRKSNTSSFISLIALFSIAIVGFYYGQFLLV